MTESIENLLYSLIPLLLIIAASWFFSFLGPRKKPKTSDELPGTAPKSVDQLFDLFPQGEEEVREAPGTARPGDVRDARQIAWPSKMPMKGPEPTPKPITPKMWGA